MTGAAIRITVYLTFILLSIDYIFWAFYILSHRFPFSVLKGFFREKYKNIARQNYRAIGYNILLNNLNFINYPEIFN